MPSRLASPPTALLIVLCASGCGSSSSDDSAVVDNVALSPASGATLPGALQFQSYTQRFTVSSGGSSPYTFSELSGALPAGLFLVSTDSSGLAVSTSSHADLVGFPSTAGLGSVKFRVTDGAGDATEPTYEVTVSAATGVGLSLSPATGTHLSDGAVSSTYGPVTLSVGNGTPGYTWRIVYGALPSGLTLTPDPSGSNSAEARISGTPLTAGTWIFAIEVRDAQNPVGVGGGAYQITIQ